MAVEPRRSARSTKGQHRSLDIEPESQKPKKASTTSKRSEKKKVEEEEEVEDEDDEDDSAIRCVCGHNTDDKVGVQWIACEACTVWQHNICMGIPENQKLLPEHYFCEECRPEEHQELLQAMERGENIWEDRMRLSKSKNKPWNAGRKSRGPRPTDGQPTDGQPTDGQPTDGQPTDGQPTDGQPTDGQPTDGQPTDGQPTEDGDQTMVDAAVEPEDNGLKRKFEEEAEPEKQAAVEEKDEEEPTNRKRNSRVDKRRKSSTKSAAEDSTTAMVDIEKLPKDRHNVAIALGKAITEVLTGDNDKSRVPEGETIDSVSNHYAQLIEYELFMNHGGPGSQSQYGNQFRTINANLKRNPVLLDRLLKKSLTPAELATMSSQDMASEELQRERERIKEEADKQATMIQEDDDKPRVRRTHKGDEYVDEAGTTGPITSIYPAQPVRPQVDEEMKDVKGSPEDSKDIKSPIGHDDEAISPVHEQQPDTVKKDPEDESRRQSAQDFDISNVWAKTAATTNADASVAQATSPSTASIAIPTTTMDEKATGDEDIDRLLADDDQEDDNYSPAEARTNSVDIIWQGQLIQTGVASLATSARFVAGNDFSKWISWADFLPSTFEIEGRLDATKADAYLCGLQWSKKADVTVLGLTSQEDTKSFDVIFDYFHSRDRYAVGKKAFGCSDYVRDIYISPVEKGGKLPPHIDLLDYCGLTIPTTERILLATFVVNKPSSWEQSDGQSFTASSTAAPSNRMSLPGPLGSPINQQAPNFSPAPPGTVSTNGQYQSAFPSTTGISLKPAVIQILGPYVNCLVATTIFEATNGMVAEHEAANMRHIFERDARATEDMEIFTRILNPDQYQ